jgi:hypothetical protein
MRTSVVPVSRRSSSPTRTGRTVAVFALGLSLVAMPASIRAQAPPTSNGDSHLDLGVGIVGGTLGTGLEVSKLIVGNVGVRTGFNYFSFSLNHTISDVQYSGKLRLQTIPLLVDVYPFARGPFHLTGGVMLNQTQLTGTGVPDPAGTISINHTTYTQAQIGVLSAAVKYPSTGGYLGLGFGTPAFKSRIAGVFDVGAILSKAKVSLNATGAGTDPQLASDLAAQQATTQTSVNKLSVYPVMSAGILVRF